MERKISFRMEASNVKKMEAITKNTGITQTEFINKACAEIPIICLENSEGLADKVIDLISLVEDNDLEEFRKEVDVICQSLKSLTEEILNFHSSQKS